MLRTLCIRPPHSLCAIAWIFCLLLVFSMLAIKLPRKNWREQETSHTPRMHTDERGRCLWRTCVVAAVQVGNRMLKSASQAAQVSRWIENKLKVCSRRQPRRTCAAGMCVLFLKAPGR